MTMLSMLKTSNTTSGAKCVPASRTTMSYICSTGSQKTLPYYSLPTKAIFAHKLDTNTACRGQQEKIPDGKIIVAQIWPAPDTFTNMSGKILLSGIEVTSERHNKRSIFNWQIIWEMSAFRSTSLLPN